MIKVLNARQIHELSAVHSAASPVTAEVKLFSGEVVDPLGRSDSVFPRLITHHVKLV